MKYRKADSCHIVQHMTKLKHQLSGADHSYWLQNIDVVQPCRKKFFERGWFTKLTWRIDLNKTDSGLKHLNRYLLYSRGKMHQSTLRELWAHAAVIFKDVSLVKAFPRFESSLIENMLCPVAATFSAYTWYTASNKDKSLLEPLNSHIL